jgi:uncharacterized protein
MSPEDFSRRTTFPGTFNGPFNKVLRIVDAVERIPNALLALLLFVLALLPLHASLTQVVVLWFFFLGDWVLLSALPSAGQSFGPAKPPVLMLALMRVPFAFLPGPYGWFMQVLGTLLVIYAFWIEPHALRITRQRLRSEKLVPGTALRLLHLSDLHLERTSPRERQLNRLIADLQPDVIVFTGDFLNLSRVHDPESWADVRSLIASWRAPLGVYVVTGSPPVDQPEVVAQLLAGMDHIRCLHDERIGLVRGHAELDLLGLDCTHKPHLDRDNLARLMDDRLSSRFTILLYHAPDLAPSAEELGVDLMLSGHTHGGQVRLPWFGALYTSSLYGKRFEAGRYALGKGTLYVSRGIGMEGKGAPRVRFLCPPEIVLWDIEGGR